MLLDRLPQWEDMLDASEIRRANLRALIAEHSTALVIERLGITKQQLSQYAGRNPNRQIGISFARRIETAFQKPRGWMDNWHGDDSEALRAAIDYARQLSPLQLQNLLQFLQAAVALSKVEALNATGRSTTTTEKPLNERGPPSKARRKR